MHSKWLNVLALAALALAVTLVVFGNLHSETSSKVVNVSSDATHALSSKKTLP